jgi:hypothetical protein
LILRATWPTRRFDESKSEELASSESDMPFVWDLRGDADESCERSRHAAEQPDQAVGPTPPAGCLRTRRAGLARCLSCALARRPEAIRLTTHNQASRRLACGRALFSCRLWSDWPPPREVAARSSSQRAGLGASRLGIATAAAQAATHPSPARIAFNAGVAIDSAKPSANLVSELPGAVPSQCPTLLLRWLPRKGAYTSPSQQLSRGLRG